MDLNRFIIDLIRKNSIKWMEERRLDFVPLLSEFLAHLIDGKTILIITDEEREWYSEYLIKKINNFNEFKPSFIPVFDLSKIVPQIKMARHPEQFDMIEDMLNIAYEEYIFWYIGKETNLLKFARRKDNSFYWIMDNDLSRNFYLKSLDVNLDKKLLDLAFIVNESIKAVIFGEIEI
ncbi:HobA family DNA replication regulator [Caminibacter sp.]